MENREKTIIRTSIIGIIGNIILVAFKALVGFIAGSVSIIMDAKDGKIDTDLYGASAFVISIGALVSLSSAPKTIIDNTRAKIEAKMKENDPEPETGDEES